MVRSWSAYDSNHGSARLGPGRVFVDVLLLRIVNAHQRLDRFDDALRVSTK